MVVYLDFEYIVFSLQNTAAQTQTQKIPEGVEVSSLGNFSYSRFFKMAAKSHSGNINLFTFWPRNMYNTTFLTKLTTRNSFPAALFF